MNGQTKLFGERLLSKTQLPCNNTIMTASLHHTVCEGAPSLTVVRPAGVEHMVCIRSEADVQDAPAHVSSLHCSPQNKAPSGGVVQTNVLVYGEQQKKTKVTTN